MPKKTSVIKASDSNKAWNRKKKNKMPYHIESIAKKKAFLIICEGKNTEPEYFKSFPIASATVKTIGLGASKKYLVDCAVEFAKEYKEYEIWCVFDLDIAPDNLKLKDDFNLAITYAKHKGFQVAYSNDAFELWLVLHYKIIDAQLTRNEYYKMLSGFWQVNYEKEGKKASFCKTIYPKLQHTPANQEQAILRAENLHTLLIDENYCDQNPCTTVYQLVKALNACI